MDLPTEAQWEFAARNRGQMFIFATDNGKAEPGRNVWGYQQRKDYIRENQLNIGYNPSLPLGQFPPTPLGLYDMMTDGFEWMLDWYDESYYAKSPERNPKGPAQGTERVLRSFRSQEGKSLSFGDGMTFERNHRMPNPVRPSINRLTGKSDGVDNLTDDTSARCVVNSSTELKFP
jgi:formylglycine-generating enzyme required for sulfatase activity